MIWGLLAGLAALRLVVAAVVPLAPDEAYYWTWSHALAPGYLDHPPMVALWIRAGTAIAGEGVLGVRLLAPFSALAGSALLLQAGRDLLGDARAAARAVWLLNATLLFGVGAVTMTPDTPLLFFWTAAVWAMARLHRTGRAGWWLVAGAATGLAMDSKYTAALLAGGIGLWVLLLPAGRRWLRCWQSWAGGGLAALLFLPVILWNAGHGWASFAKQGGRGSVWHPLDAARYLGELIGGQAGLATPLVFVLCVAGIFGVARAAWRRRDGASGLLAALSVPPVLLFVEHAIGDRVQANWPAIIYPAAVLAAVGLGGVWARLVRPGIALGFAVTALVYVQAATGLLPLPASDPTARLAGWDGLAAGIAAQAGSAAFVASDNYGEAALLARLLPGTLPVIGVEPRWALFRLPDARATMAGRAGLLVRSAHRGDPRDTADWASIRPLGTLWRARDGRKVEPFTLYAVIGRDGDGPAALLPRLGTGPGAP